jgi:hypothetical protein
VAVTCCQGQGTHIEVAGVRGCESTAIRHCDGDGITGNAGIDVGAGWFEIMSGGSGVCDSIIVELGWGSAKRIVDRMVISSSVTV